MPIARSHKLTFFTACIWSCNNSSDTPLVSHSKFSCYLTISVEIVKPHRFFIAAYLHNRISRSVDYQSSCLYLLLTKFIQYNSAACGFISYYLSACSFFKLCDKFLWKSCFGKCDKRFCGVYTHHFPVSCHGILAIASFIHRKIISEWLFYRCDLF